jgi:hypothetical protein
MCQNPNCRYRKLQKVRFLRSKIAEHFFKKFGCPPQNKILRIQKKMLTGIDATALSKKKKFRSELDPRFGFTPVYGNVERVNMAADPLSLQTPVSRLE